MKNVLCDILDMFSNTGKAHTDALRKLIEKQDKIRKEQEEYEIQQSFNFNV